MFILKQRCTAVRKVQNMFHTRRRKRNASMGSVKTWRGHLGKLAQITGYAEWFRKKSQYFGRWWQCQSLWEESSHEHVSEWLPRYRCL